MPKRVNLTNLFKKRKRGSGSLEVDTKATQTKDVENSPNGSSRGTSRRSSVSSKHQLMPTSPSGLSALSERSFLMNSDTSTSEGGLSRASSLRTRFKKSVSQLSWASNNKENQIEVSNEDITGTGEAITAFDSFTLGKELNIKVNTLEELAHFVHQHTKDQPTYNKALVIKGLLEDLKDTGIIKEETFSRVYNYVFDKLEDVKFLHSEKFL